MKEKMLCGSSCVKYVVQKLAKEDKNINPSLFWTCDLSLELTKLLHNKIEVRCYNSNLYNDYKKEKNNGFAGFKSINDYLSNNGSIIEKELTKGVLEKEISESKYMIVCVESKLLNNNEKMTGGHFVVIEKYKDKIKMINPLKEGYEEIFINKDYIINLCINYGSWRILIK